MIRDATKADATAITDIYNYYIRNTVITFEIDPVSEIEIIKRIDKINTQGHRWLVAEVDRQIIGYAYSAKWAERAAYINTAEVSAYISKDYTQKGWGTKLYQALFDDLRSKKIHVIIGGITLPNEESAALHEKFGMAKVAHFKEVGFKLGKWLDVGYWQVKIDA